jgi:predicted HTH transcriptional regulator
MPMPKSKSAKAPKHAFTSLRPAATTKDERIVSERQSGIRTHKLEIVISLLRRPEGATVGDLVEATGWQSHSVRAMISKAVKKKQIMKVISEGAGISRVYRVAS